MIPPHAGLRLHGGPGRKVLVEFFGNLEAKEPRAKDMSPFTLRVQRALEAKGYDHLQVQELDLPTRTDLGATRAVRAEVEQIIPPHAGLRPHGDPGRKVPVRFFGNLRAQEPKVKGIKSLLFVGRGVSFPHQRQKPSGPEPRQGPSPGGGCPLEGKPGGTGLHRGLGGRPQGTGLS